nr:hypothetical protein [Spirochaetota bacterium]
VWLKVLNTDMTVYETKEGYITANGTSTSFTLTNNYDGMTDYNVEVYIDANQDYNISTGDKALTGVSYKIASDSSIWVDTFYDYTDGGTAVGTITLDGTSSGLSIETVYIRITDDTGAAIQPATGYAQFMLNAGMGYFDMMGTYTEGMTYMIDLFVDKDGNKALSTGDLYNNTYSFNYYTGFALTVYDTNLLAY